MRGNLKKGCTQLQIFKEMATYNMGKIEVRLKVWKITQMPAWNY